MEVKLSSSGSSSAIELKKHVVSKPNLLCHQFYAPHPMGIFYGESPLEFSFSLVLFQIILIIVFSRIVRFLLKPFKQPKFVSDLIGGILIGPSVLGRNKTFASNVFPPQSQFLVNNMAILGFMYFLFVAGVKMDVTLVAKTTRKHMYAALAALFVPLLTTSAVGFILRSSMDQQLAKLSGFGAIAADLAFTSFPVIHLILKELNLLSSEIGRMALTSALVSDAIGIVAVVVFEAMKQGEGSAQAAIWYVVSTVVIAFFYIFPIRRALHWVVKKTPTGKPVNQSYVIIILLGVAVMGFFTDMFGLAIANGSLWLGLVIPDGPPLGATIVERCETVVMELLMPFSFALVGLCTDVFAMAEFGWSKLEPVFILMVVGYFSKIATVMVAALRFKVPVKDSLTLGFIMNLRGQLELVIFVHWMDKKMIGIEIFTMLVLCTTLVTSISTPLIRLLYNPTRPYMINRRRTIQHNPPGKELRIVVCIHDKETVVGLLDLLEVSYPTISSPFSVYALHLVELVGRAAPAFVEHQQGEGPSKHPDHEAIYKALKIFEEARNDCLELHFFTAITVRRTMYQDICKLALLNKASLIILPFEKGRLETLAGTEIVRHGRGMRSISADVIAHAPCSVGILVDKGNARNAIRVQPHRHSPRCRRYVMLFLGGADAREALIYADRMGADPEVQLTVARFLSHNNEGDDEMEKKLDDGVVTWFWMKNEGNERMVYKEVVVKNGAETLEAVQALNNDDNDLWVVGRKQGINPVILKGISHWSEHFELGVIGDFIASLDFGSKASVLVIHQQIMRVQGTSSSRK